LGIGVLFRRLRWGKVFPVYYMGIFDFKNGYKFRGLSIVEVKGPLNVEAARGSSIRFAATGKGCFRGEYLLKATLTGCKS
jgi:hypothetical protein